jgi:hypothetical protein
MKPEEKIEVGDTVRMTCLCHEGLEGVVFSDDGVLSIAGNSMPIDVRENNCTIILKNQKPEVKPEQKNDCDRSNWDYSDYEYEMTCEALKFLFEQLEQRNFTEARRAQLDYLLLKEQALRGRVWR